MKIEKALFLFLVAILTGAATACGPLPHAKGDRESHLVFMSYNVWNLFDDHSDGSEYPEFDPESSEWSSDAYHKRLSLLAGLIESAAPGGADVVLLQEVENRRVLEELAALYLSRYGYDYVFCPSREGSAVNTGVMSRIPLTGLRAHSAVSRDGYGGRYILEVSFKRQGDSFVLFNNHWKSKRGGAEATENLRRQQAALLNRLMTAALQEGGGADYVLAAGDFNESWDEELRVDGAYPTALHLDPHSGEGIALTADRRIAAAAPGPPFFTPWAGHASSGSYAFGGEWAALDQFMLSGGLLDGQGWEYRRFEVCGIPELFGGNGYPQRWRSADFRGYSDHLPVLLYLKCGD